MLVLAFGVTLPIRTETKQTVHSVILPDFGIWCDTSIDTSCRCSPYTTSKCVVVVASGTLARVDQSRSWSSCVWSDMILTILDSSDRAATFVAKV